MCSGSPPGARQSTVALGGEAQVQISTQNENDDKTMMLWWPDLFGKVCEPKLYVQDGDNSNITSWILDQRRLIYRCAKLKAIEVHNKRNQ